VDTSMRHFIKRDLMNAGLVQLTPTLIDRYNVCLESMGLTPTARRQVFVDGVGWSPQVAREQKNPYYLCNGLANPTAIIVSPEQYRKPVYTPVYSWMRSLMKFFFSKYHREIADITATHVISIDFENGLSNFTGPEDLLLLSGITANPNFSELAARAQEQKKLVEHFLEGLNCLDPQVRAELGEHRREFGDLRRRRVAMSSLVFDLFSDFYTVAFDGAAVIRSGGDTDLLVLESQATFESVKSKERSVGAEICYLYDPSAKPFELLRKARKIEFPIERFRKNPAYLVEKRDLLLGLSLCDCEPGLDWNKTPASKRKALMRKHEDKVPRLFTELERFIAALKRGTKVPSISAELWYLLAEPSHLLPTTSQEVMWILLTRRSPMNVLESYTYDKNHFFALLPQWSDAKQKWVAEYLAARYVPRMSQP